MGVIAAFVAAAVLFLMPCMLSKTVSQCLVCLSGNPLTPVLLEYWLIVAVIGPCCPKKGGDECSS